MSKLSLAHWLQRLEQLHPVEVELGLQRCGEVATRLDLLPLACPVLTVAGTNGKGSTVAVAQAVAQASGRLTGQFTSPHFLRFNERIQVGGQEADDSEIVAAFEQIDAARDGTSLTYFEFATLAALLIFRQRSVELAILEVGLGGRLDAVNIVDPSVAVITSIDLDHQDWLGDDRDSIGREKAGILRAASPAVIADPRPPAGLLQAVADNAAEPFYLGEHFGFDEVEGGLTMKLQQRGGEQQSLLLSQPLSVLPVNACAALQALLLLDVDLAALDIAGVVASVRPTGRQQSLVVGGQQLVLDVAHNPGAVDKMIEYMAATNCNKRTIAIFSAMKDKDIHGMISRSLASFDAWFLADQPDQPRAAAAADIAAVLHEQGCKMISVSKNLRQAYRRARSLLGEGDRLVVFGSFHTVAAILPLVDKDLRKEQRG
jgi:dihydrofolate synthase/folylpolyglutamate synthase